MGANSLEVSQGTGCTDYLMTWLVPHGVRGTDIGTAGVMVLRSVQG